jgi:hypothetical protein
MRRSTISGVATFGVALLVASSAWAACTQADLTGSWRVHVHGATPGDGSFWTRCAITIAATTGNVSGSCRTDEGVNFNLEAGGRLRVVAPLAACVVTGTVNTPEGVNRILDAGIDRGKTVISGVGIDPNGDRFAFTGVKR